MTAPLDQTSRILIAHVLADLDARIKDAAFHAICGKPSDETMASLYRRVANNHRCTPEDVRRWWEASETEFEKGTKA